jgi:hypothetical protein
MHENEPSPATFTVPSLHEELEMPKYGVTRSPDVNPEPVNVTVLPTSPLEGLNVSEGSTVNVTDALFVPSVACRVCGPAGAAGIVTVHGSMMSPYPSELHAEPAVNPSSVNVIGNVTAKPDPDIVVMLPTIPSVGPMIVSEGSTVKFDPALIGPRYPSFASIQYDPAGASGTVIPHENEPSGPTVPPELHEYHQLPPRLGVMPALAVNPVPASVTVLPAIPFEGLNVSEGSTTNGCVSVLRAESVAVTV